MRSSILLAAMLIPPVCHTAVIDFDVVSRQPIAVDSTTRFGQIGVAEKIMARATIALNPKDPRNQAIVDLQHAPTDPDGTVRAVTDVIIVRPSKPNGSLLVELPNRGGTQLFGTVNDLDTAAAQGLDRAGNGFLLARGYTLVLVGWQGDVARDKGVGIQLPIAKGLTGFSRDQWKLTDAERIKQVTLSWPVHDPKSARLTVRASVDSEPAVPPDLSFRLIDDRTVEITRPAGAAGVGIYELSYIAIDPAIMVMGFAAVRDVASFLKLEKRSNNPLAADGVPSIRHAIATGVSQSGRALRDLLYFGFNEDEHGRQVFDGMLPLIPGTRRSFTNARFAQPGRNPGPEADQHYPVDQFPFTYEVTTDPLTGNKDGLLLRCRRSNTCPKIMQFDSEYEFWGARGSLLVTDAAGKAIELPANVRAYMLAGAPHSNPWNAVSTRDPRCVMPSSPVIAGPAIRALLTAMNEWVSKDVAPPPSRYPSVADGTLVPAAEVYGKGIPVPYRRQYLHAPLVEQTSHGPVVKGEYPVLLPKANADGNAIAGIHLPIVATPRATHTAWNPQLARSGPQDLCNHASGMIPFARTRAERVAAHDSRRSIEERYPTPATYLAAARSAIEELVKARLLLQEDAYTALAEAKHISADTSAE